MNLKASLNLNNFSTFFIQEEGNYFDRNLTVDRCRIFFHGLFLNNPQYLQSRRFGITNMASTVATWAGDMASFG